MLNILNKNFFKTKTGRMLARKYFGYRYDDGEEQGKDEQISEATIIKPAKQEEAACDVNHEIQQTQQPPMQAAPNAADNTLKDFIGKVVEKPNFEDIFNERKGLVRLSQQIEETSNRPSTKNSMSLYDIVRHYNYRGVVGEENLVSGITLAAIGGSSFVVLGYSGSGKTFIADRMIDLLFDVYKLQQSSDTAIFNDTERINGSRFIYIPELQKAMKNKKSTVIEAIKDLTEGKDANRIVTSKKGEGIIKYSIKKGVRIIGTLAIENDFKMDEESARRLIHFRTDSSEKHLNEIHDQKAKRRYTLIGGKKAATALEERIREHVHECIELGEINIIDPFSVYITELVPKTQKSVGYIDHYYSLLDACARFHFNQRTRFEINGEVYLMVNLEDHYNVFQIYFKEFIQTLKDFSKENEEPLKELANIPEPDWKKCFAEGYKVVTESPELEVLRRNYSSELEKWYLSQISSGKIKTQDYKTGNIITIANLSEEAKEEKVMEHTNESG